MKSVLADKAELRLAEAKKVCDSAVVKVHMEEGACVDVGAPLGLCCGSVLVGPR